MTKIRLSDRAKDVDKKPLSLGERMYLPVLKGMGITFTHMFKKQPTIKYPEVKREFSSVWRGLHILKRDENGAERCTACGLCALSCPAEAITMEAAERKPGEEHLYREEKYAARYEINMLRCIFCGLCEEACPKEAIFLSQSTASANYDRKSFIYGKDKLVEPVNPPAGHVNAWEENYRKEWMASTTKKSALKKQQKEEK